MQVVRALCDSIHKNYTFWIYNSEWWHRFVENQ